MKKRSAIFSETPPQKQSAKLIGSMAAIGLLLGSMQGCAPKDEAKDRRSIPLESVPGSFIVGMTTSSAESGGLDASQKALLSAAEPLAQELGCELQTPDASGGMSSTLMHTFHLQFESCRLDEEAIGSIQSKLIDDDAIESVESNAVVRIGLSENDPYKSRQYYLGNIGRDEACELAAGKQGKPVVVAVVDSGVDKDHPDLVKRFFRDANGQVIGANFVGKGSRGAPDSNWDDANGHGTHVAGIVAASANNQTGVAGVAGCANVAIMPIRVMGANGSGSSLEIDRGIQWAAARGADIINLSLGSNSLSYRKQSSHPKSLYQSLEKQGVAVFAAAGNDGLVNGSSYSGRGYIYSYPASYNGVIAVASTEERNRLSSFSNRGEHIDIAAPGSNILSTYPGGGYQFLSGTSMATPVAVGAYALALATVRDSGREILYHDELESILMTAISRNVGFGSSDVISGGLLNAPLLVKEVQARFPEQKPEEPAPTEPQQPNPEQPAPEQPDDEVTPQPSGLSFVGLQDGQTLQGATRIAVTGWPQGSYRIYLYWLSGNEWFPRSFTSIGRENLTSDGETVVTPDYYYLYGNKKLIAEAVDAYGRRLKITSISLKGLR